MWHFPQPRVEAPGIAHTLGAPNFPEWFGQHDGGRGEARARRTVCICSVLPRSKFWDNRAGGKEKAPASNGPFPTLVTKALPTRTGETRNYSSGFPNRGKPTMGV